MDIQEYFRIGLTDPKEVSKGTSQIWKHLTLKEDPTKPLGFDYEDTPQNRELEKQIWDFRRPYETNVIFRTNRAIREIYKDSKAFVSEMVFGSSRISLR